MILISLAGCLILCLLGCWIAAKLAKRQTGASLIKRILQALLIASLFSWTFFIFSAGHSGGIDVSPSIRFIFLVAMKYSEGNLESDGFILMLIPLASLAAVFAAYLRNSNLPAKVEMRDFSN
jgi:hypothetical protein